jgi:hypothetical protein
MNQPAQPQKYYVVKVPPPKKYAIHSVSIKAMSDLIDEGKILPDDIVRAPFDTYQEAENYIKKLLNP